MAKTLGYMVTFTTYGTWLEGDERGFVKDGITYAAKQSLADSNKQNLSKNLVRLSKTHRAIAAKAIYEKVDRLNQKILALVVCSNHVHVVADYVPVPIGKVVSYYKKCSTSCASKSRFDRQNLDKRIRQAILF